MLAPLVHLHDLDTVWIQLTGTVCNIACRHCFISCGPKVRTHEPMTAEHVVQTLDDAATAGVREVWFTGGEPLLHDQALDLIERALERSAVGLLTNGMLIDDAVAERLGELFAQGPYNLEVRISFDGPDAASHDAIRGRGAFAAACEGVRRLGEHGVLPILAVSVLDDQPTQADAFVTLLGTLGIDRPRIKWIPPFRIGREERRGRAYEPWEVLSDEDLTGDELPLRLMCGTTRAVTSKGVYPCPILINELAPMADTLQAAEALQSVNPSHEACYTCWVEGFSCST